MTSRALALPPQSPALSVFTVNLEPLSRALALAADGMAGIGVALTCLCDAPTARESLERTAATLAATAGEASMRDDHGRAARERLCSRVAEAYEARRRLEGKVRRFRGGLYHLPATAQAEVRAMVAELVADADGAPDDIRELTRLAETRGPELLSRMRPAKWGLVLVHPDSDACPAPVSRVRRVHAIVLPVDDVIRMARELHVEAHRPDGWHLGLLVGATHSAVVRLAPASVASRRAS